MQLEVSLTMHGNRDDGFTLLELMLVMLVMVLTLAVTLPSLSRGSAALHLRAASRDIISTVRYAREKAITEQTGMMVTVNRQEQKVILSDQLGDGARTYSMPPDVKIQGVARGGQEIPDGPLVIRFLPNGSSDDAQILLKSDSGAFLRIITDPITGGARVEQGQGENGP